MPRNPEVTNTPGTTAKRRTPRAKARYVGLREKDYAPTAPRKRPGTLTPEQIAERLQPRGIELIGEYRTTSLPATFKAACGHFWRVTAGNVINSKSGCPICAHKRNGEYARAIVARNRAAKA